MGYFNNPSLVIKVNEERFNALRKALKWQTAFDDKASEMLNRINERAKLDGKFYHIPFYTDEAVRFAYLFASLSEAFIGLLDSVKADVVAQSNAIADTQITLESIASAMSDETELIADKKLRSFSVLKREEKSYIKRYIRNGCGGNLISFGEQDYSEDERLPEITNDYLQSVADYIGVPFGSVNENYQEMLSCYKLVLASGYPNIGRGDKTLSEDDRQAKFNLLCVVIPKYSIDWNGFQYGRVLQKKLNCSESLFRRAMQYCKENL